MKQIFRRCMAGFLAAMVLCTGLPMGEKKREVYAAAGTYGSATQLTDGTGVSAVEGLCVTSPNNLLKTQIMTDADTGRFFYTVSRNGATVIQASQLGIVAETDFSQGLVFVEGSMAVTEGTESYENTTGSAAVVNDSYKEMTFDLAKQTDESKRIKVCIKSFNGGLGYRYILHGSAGKTEKISKEASEYVLPSDATAWVGDSTDVNYEFNYVSKTMSDIHSASTKYPIPFLAKSGDNWILIAESNVYNEEDPYCASYLQTEKELRNLKVVFGNKQTGNVVKTYGSDGTFHTPWRTMAIAGNLNNLVNSSVFTSLNPAPDTNLFADTSYIKTGKVAWSWWSESGDDPVEYDQQKDYIDFAAKNGWEYVCVDFGWCLWNDYKTKVKELADYAAKKNVGLVLWYGVNNANHSGFKDENGDAAYPKYSLRTKQQYEEQFAWCKSVGIKGVKVDYYESDNQATMKQMYQCATIAAKNKLCVLFHGCNVPSGEQRTFPNVLGYEAVRGAEWFKWNVGPTVATQLTYLFTRNILGGMDYTPPAMKINQLSTTAGYQLAQVVVYETGFQNIASSVYKLEGFEGLPLINEIPTQWEETKLLDGYPGSYLAVARRSGNEWYIGAMTAAKKTMNLNLNFLGEGTYTATFYQDSPDGKKIETKVQTVEKNDVLPVNLLANGGVSIHISKTAEAQNHYEDYTYYEAEEEGNVIGGKATVITNQFVSGMKRVTGLGNGKENALTIKNINASEDGVYEMRLYYSTGVERRICYQVGNGAVIRSKKLNCGVNALSAESFFVNLKKGENAIAFFNETAKAPDVDRIAISSIKSTQAATKTDLTEDEEDSEDGWNYKYDMYEGKDAILEGGAVMEQGGIGWLGNSDSCTATFEVEVKKTGKYKLQIIYYAGETRDIQYMINYDDETIGTISCPSTGTYTPESAESIFAEVELGSGVNEITLFNAKGWAPNIVGIGISQETVKTPVVPTPPKNPNPIATPQEVVISSIQNTGKGINLRWKKTKNTTGYLVYRKGTKGGFALLKKITSDKTVSYTDKSAKNGSIYIYKVVAYHKTKIGKCKEAKSMIRLAAPKLLKPVGKTVKKKKYIKVNYRKNSKASGFLIQYGTRKSFRGAKATTKANLSVKKGNTYWIRMRCFKKSKGKRIYSAWSTVKSIRVR